MTAEGVAAGVDPRGRGLRRWLWALALAAMIACVALVGAVVAVRCWPQAVMPWMPTGRSAVIALGLVGEEAADEAAIGAAQRIDALGFDLKDAARTTLTGGGRWSRRGALRLLAVWGGRWRTDLPALRDLVRPSLGDPDRSLRRPARRAYTLDGQEILALGQDWLRRSQAADGSWPAATTAIAPGYAPGPIGATALATLAALQAEGTSVPVGWTGGPSLDRSARAGLAWLVAAQRADGTFAEDPRDDALVIAAFQYASAYWSDATVDDALHRAYIHGAKEPVRGIAADDPLLVDALLSLQPASAPAAAGRWADSSALAEDWRRCAGCAAVTLADAEVESVRLRLPPLRTLAPATVGTIIAVAPERWSPFMLARAARIIGHESESSVEGWNGYTRDWLADAQRLGDPATDGSWDPPSGDARDRAVVTACRLLAWVALRRK